MTKGQYFCKLLVLTKVQASGLVGDNHREGDTESQIQRDDF